MTFLANTKEQQLEKHSFAIGYIAYEIIMQLYGDIELAKAGYISGCGHDVGKTDPNFQEFIIDELTKKKDDAEEGDGVHITNKKFSFEKYPRHNEISALMFHYFFDNTQKKINTYNIELIEHVIYWHHAKPIRKDGFETYDDVYKKLDNFEEIFKNCTLLINDINTLARSYGFDYNIDVFRDSSETNKEPLRYLLPKYKNYNKSDELDDYISQISQNATYDIVRNAVIVADRLVSSLSSGELNIIIANKNLKLLLQDKTNYELNGHVEACIEHFKTRAGADVERNKSQKIAAIELSRYNHHVQVLEGPAGCGKTKIALEWAMNTDAKRIIWVCPRVQICQGLYTDLSNDLYLLGAKVEIFTGELKKTIQNKVEEETNENSYFSGDIIITTIDQIINSIVTSRHLTTFKNFMDYHVVFDEFHEFLNVPAHSVLFSELLKCKEFQSRSNTILVSATPNYYYVNKVLGIDDYNIVSVKSFNKSKYRLLINQFDHEIKDDMNPLYQAVDDNTFVISNTAKVAQDAFIQHQENENALLFHSKFQDEHKVKIFKNIMESFGENKTPKYDLVRSGPIIQASLNISSKHMIAELSTAENTLQRFGRLNRFSEHDCVCEFILAVPQDFTPKNSPTAAFLNRQHLFKSSNAWLKFLSMNHTKDIISIEDLYVLYHGFYRDSEALQSIQADLLGILTEGVKKINDKVFDPIQLPMKLDRKEGRLQRNSLRGTNKYVKLAICKIRSYDDFEILNEYTKDAFTMPTYEVCKDENELINFMIKNHHNLTDAKKLFKKQAVLLGKARDIDHPIHLSYLPDELDVAEIEALDNFVYYLEGIQQPIGSYTLNEI